MFVGLLSTASTCALTVGDAGPTLGARRNIQPRATLSEAVTHDPRIEPHTGADHGMPDAELVFRYM